MTVDAGPSLALDELKSGWLLPEREEEFSLPALMGPRGMVQAAWSVSAIRNWIHPPTGMASESARLYRREGGAFRPFPSRVLYRWSAFEIERRARGVFTTTRLATPRDGVMQRMRIDVAGTYALVVGGLPRTWRFTDYWNLPEWDVPQRNVRRAPGGALLDDVKTFGEARFFLPGRVEFFRDEIAWLSGAAPVDDGGAHEAQGARGGIAVATFEAAAGDDVEWSAVQGCEGELEPLGADAWDSGRVHWERVWRAAFTPGNDVFSGSLPPPSGSLARLYAMSVLTALCCRRDVPKPTRRSGIATGGQCIWNADDSERRALDVAYVWGGPEGGMTTLFLWELEIAAPLLARLDPAVLRELIDAMLGIDLTRSWGLETVSMSGAGMGYGINPGGILSIVADYVRITGDAAFARARADLLRGFCRPGLTDYGSYENVLECVSTYQGRVASFNALNAKGMRFLGELSDDASLVRAADALEREIVALYDGGPFACLWPDGTRRTVRTALDAIYVGRSIGARLPADVRRGMVAFVRDELIEPAGGAWMRALSLRDDDSATAALPIFQRYRADHQSTGSYDGWPARAASMLARFGERELARGLLHEIQGLTWEGPFGQAHRIHADGPRKASFFNGNCAVNLAGSAFATTILEDLA